MALTLSSTDLTRLRASLAALVSPLDHATVQEWGAAVLREMCPLLAADQAFFSVPPAGAEPESDGEGRRDWCVPHRLQDAIGMGVQVDDGPLPALAHFYHDRRSGRVFGDRGLALLRLMLPAFKAGVLMRARMARHRDTLTSALDGLSEPLAIFGPAGRLVHANPAFGAIVVDDPEGTQLLAAAREAARSFGRLVGQRPRGSESDDATSTEPQAVLRDVRTGRGRYRVRGSLLGHDLITRGPSALVAIQRILPEPLSEAALRERFRLTPREVAVARLLAEGRSNHAIASALGVSARTAEHHTGHVLLKLGAPSRAAAGAMMRGDSRAEPAAATTRHTAPRAGGAQRRSQPAQGSRPAQGNR